MKFEVISVKKTIGSPGKIVHTWASIEKMGGEGRDYIYRLGGNSDLMFESS